MRKKITTIAFALTVFISASLLNQPSFAEDNLEDLKKQIQILQKRVDALEAQNTQTNSNSSWDFFNRRNNQNRGRDPFSEMERMQKEMNRMFHHGQSRRGFSNNGMFSHSLTNDFDFDLKETKDSYEIKLDVKGLDEEKVDIEINEHSITVKGEHSSQDTEKNNNGYFSTQSFGTFVKTIPLPVDADTAKLKTEKEGDFIVIKLPKKIS